MFCLTCSTMYLHLGNHEAIGFGPCQPCDSFQKNMWCSKVRLTICIRRIISVEVGNWWTTGAKFQIIRENKSVKQWEQQPQERRKQKTDILGPWRGENKKITPFLSKTSYDGPTNPQVWLFLWWERALAMNFPHYIINIIVKATSLAQPLCPPRAHCSWAHTMASWDAMPWVWNGAHSNLTMEQCKICLAWTVT